MHSGLGVWHKLSAWHLANLVGSKRFSGLFMSSSASSQARRGYYTHRWSNYMCIYVGSLCVNWSMILDYVTSCLCHMPYNIWPSVDLPSVYPTSSNCEHFCSHTRTYSTDCDEVILSWGDKLNLGENPATLMRQSTRSLLGSNPIPIPIPLQFRFPQNGTTGVSA